MAQEYFSEIARHVLSDVIEIFCFENNFLKKFLCPNSIVS